VYYFVTLFVTGGADMDVKYQLHT